jgi:hypothetical protein
LEFRRSTTWAKKWLAVKNAKKWQKITKNNQKWPKMARRPLCSAWGSAQVGLGGRPTSGCRSRGDCRREPAIKIISYFWDEVRVTPGADFSYIFSGENFGENSRENFGENSAENFPPKNGGKKCNFLLKKSWKIVFQEILRNFPREKMYEKMAPDGHY